MWDEETILNITIIPYDHLNNVLKSKQNKATKWLTFSIVGYVCYTIKHED